MTPDGEVTLKDVYELVDKLRNEQKADIGAVQKTVDDYKALAADGRVICEKRFGDIEGDLKTVNMRVYYAFAGITMIGTVVLGIIWKLIGG